MTQKTQKRKGLLRKPCVQLEGETSRHAAVRLNKEGWNNAKIGKTLGITRERVRQFVGRSSRKRPVIDYLLSKADALLASVEQGQSERQIAEAFGVSPMAVRTALAELKAQAAEKVEVGQKGGPIKAQPGASG